MAFKNNSKINIEEKAIISLDIGSHSIKMVRGMKNEGKIKILDFIYREYSISEGKSEVISGLINELLSSVLTTKKLLKTAKIHSTISGRKLCIRVVRLPVMPEQEIYQAIKSKIRKFVSPDTEQVQFTISVVGDSQEEGVKKLEVLFAAIQKDILNEYLQWFKLTNVQPKLLTSACFSGWSLVRELRLDRDSTALMLINVERHETDLTVYRKGQFIFTRTISIGEKDFIDIIKGQSRPYLQKPQNIRQLWSINSEPAPSELKEKEQFMKLKENLQNEANVFCKEIELTSYHYYQITHGQKIDKCVVCGVNREISGLVDYLRQKLDIPVEALSIPDEKLELEPEKKEAFQNNLALYTQALGALLTGPNEINLISPKVPSAKMGVSLIKLSGMPKKIVVGLGLTVVGLFIIIKGINLFFRGQIKSYQAKIAQTSKQTEKLMEIRRKSDILEFEKTLYRKLINNYPSYPVVIEEIVKAIPGNSIYLDELRFYGDPNRVSSTVALPVKFSIAGSVLGQNISGTETTDFVLALEQSGYFENISVTITEKAYSVNEFRNDKSKEMGFLITGNLKIKD